MNTLHTPPINTKEPIQLEQDRSDADLINPAATADENNMRQQASRLLNERRFDESVEMFHEMSERFPGNRSLYLSQVGKSEYNMGQYQAAIDSYMRALQAGAPVEKIDNLVWETCEAIAKHKGAEPAWNRYLSLFPQGKHGDEARKRIGN